MGVFNSLELLAIFLQKKCLAGCVQTYILSIPYMNYRAAKAYVINKLDRELSPKLTYHGKHHTLDVLNVVEELCEKEGVSSQDRLLVKTAALYHDAGFTITHIEHEKLGCQIARNSLHRFDYSPEDVEKICGMIMATKIPQSPNTHLEAIICDADLDYLGRSDFQKIARTLFWELKAYDILQSEEAWNRVQVNFIGSHHFFTPTNKARREARKRAHLEELQKVVASYG